MWLIIQIFPNFDEYDVIKVVKIWNFKKTKNLGFRISLLPCVQIWANSAVKKPNGPGGTCYPPLPVLSCKNMLPVWGLIHMKYRIEWWLNKTFFLSFSIKVILYLDHIFYILSYYWWIKIFVCLKITVWLNSKLKKILIKKIEWY